MSIQGINNGFSATLKGQNKVRKHLKREHIRVTKAMNTAIRIEGFRLKNLLQKEIAQGQPGNSKLSPLSFIARRLSRTVHGAGGRMQRQSPNRTALARLAQGVRYQVSKQSPFELTVGWVGPDTITRARDFRNPDLGNIFGRGILEKDITSKKWRRLALAHQTGFTRIITPSQRRFIVGRGGELGKIEDGDTPFFLKKSTRQFKTPARPILVPFWAKYKGRSRINIDQNFRTKLAGRKI
ncbi:MAG: hypothetical protein GY710_17290 [Desulfobacteraceae bacterium]|nr:hypothetical protein [Desulfobacteraceae bacterium]